MSSNLSVSTQQVSKWLSSFGEVLDRAEYGAAVQMFEDDSYWRDLVAFTWNIKTAEGRENIRAMLEATIPKAKPGRWATEGDATSENGLLSSWFTFETVAARGKGYL